MKVFWIILAVAILVGFVFLAIIKHDTTEDLAMPVEEMAGQLSILPDSAGVVVVFDIPGILQKMDIQNIKFDKEKTQAMKMLINLDIAGIDQSKNACLFSTTVNGNVLTGVSCSLMDPEMFKNVLTTVAEADSIVQRDNYQYAIMEDEEVWVSWSNESAVAILMPDNYEELQIVQAAGKDDVLNFMDSMFDGIGESIVLRDKKFSEILTRDDDIRMWMNIRYMAIPTEPWEYADIFDLSSLKKSDNYITAVMNFEDGKIVADSWYDFSDSLGAMVARYADCTHDGIDPAMLENLNSPENPMMIMSGSLGLPKMLPLFVGDLQKSEEYAGVITLSMLYITQYGITFDDIYNAFSGDYLVVMGNMADDESKWTIRMKINDHEAFNRLMKTIGSTIAPISDKADYHVLKYKGVDFFYRVDGDIVTFTYVESFLDKVNGTTLPQEVTDKMKTTSSYMQFDLAGMLGAMLEEDLDDDTRVWMDSFSDIMGTMTSYSTKEKSNLEITMKDPAQNSLHQIVQTIVSASEK